jgi:PAS domain S-box-containing protein
VKNIGLQIFATDLDREAIDKARIGIYPQNIVADVSPERLRRFFINEERGFRVAKDIREMVVFAPQNITMDPPFTKLDVLSCRNLLIYLSSDLQKKLIPIFHYSLNPGGILFLGTAETIGSFSALFSPVDGKTRLYRRLHQSVTIPLELPAATRTAPEPDRDIDTDHSTLPRQPPPNLQTLADRVLVQRFSPVGVLCNDKGDVLYISGRAGRYLEPAVGKANLNVFAMAREGLRYDLTTTFNAAVREDRVASARGVRVGTNGGTQTVDLTVQRLLEPKELRGTVLVVISDTPSPPSSPPPAKAARPSAENPRVVALEQELQQVHEEVQIAREEMQTSQEELKSTNEELQSTNEELQSSNEELTTSKEEMQSLNEELQTVNHELQAKVDELSRSNNDMKNLLNSTDIATLFLDNELNVRRFTTPTSRLIKLIPADAGRPITDIASELHYPGLADDAREVLRTLVFKEAQVATHDKRWFAVRIMPYRTLDNVIDGVVITFTDMSASRVLEAAVEDRVAELRRATDALPNLVFGCRANGSCDYLSRQWVQYTGIPEADQVGYGWIEQAHPDDRERVWEAWRAAVKSGTTFDLELRIRAAAGQYRWFKSRSVPLRDSDSVIKRWIGSHTDIDDLKRADEAHDRDRDRLAGVLEDMSEGFIELDPRLVITFFNAAAERLLERDRREVLGANLFEAFPQARDSILQEKLREALRSRAPSAFEAELDGAGESSRLQIRLQPKASPAGIAVFLGRVTDGAP